MDQRKSTLRMGARSDNKFDNLKFTTRPPKKSGGSRLSLHEKRLNELAASKTPVVIELISGKILECEVVSCDKYAVLVAMKNGGDEKTIFKHSVESFCIDKRREKAKKIRSL